MEVAETPKIRKNSLFSRFVSYWVENAKMAKDWHENGLLICAIIFGIIRLACWLSYVETPFVEAAKKVSEDGAIFLSVVWCFVWIPFRRHESLTNEKCERNRVVLKKMTDLIYNTQIILGFPETKGGQVWKYPYDSTGVLAEFSLEIETEEDVEWFCSELKRLGYGDPFEPIELYWKNFMKGQRLPVLRDSIHSPIKIRSELQFRQFLNLHWIRRDEWKKMVTLHEEKVRRELLK